jgi:hypothetical protein
VGAIFGSWKRLARREFGLADRISDAIAALEWRDGRALTNVRESRELLVACDFGGSHRTASYQSFAFLIGAIGGSARWMEERLLVRRKHLQDGRRMAYKALNDRQRRNALQPFLAAADLYPGNLFVFLVSKGIATLFDDPGSQRLFPELVVAVRNWKTKSFQRLLLIASLGSTLISGLSSPGQDILWITDQDEIAANPQKHDHAGHVIHHCISTYAPANLGQLVFLTTEANIDNRMTDDVVAVADLAAGCMVDAFGSGDHMPPKGLWVSPAEPLSDKCKSVLAWLAQTGAALRRIVVVLDQNTDGSLAVRAFQPILSGDGHAYVLR